MKRTILVLALTATVCAVFAACMGASKEAPKQGASLGTEAVASKATPTRVLAGSPSFDIPKPMMLGALDPIPMVDENGNDSEHFILVVANLGYYQTPEQLRKSPFYAQLCDLYPKLSEAKDFVDTGAGDLWFIRPWTENTSLAINEYTMKMFMGEEDESKGKVLYRTEYAKPMLLRMKADDPGSVKINAVDNSGHRLTWIPAQTPQDNVLRSEIGVVNNTYNAVDNSAEFGTDYVGQKSDGESVLIRFYADRQVRIGEQLARYIAYHQEDGEIGLFIEGDGIESYAVISGFAPDQQFSLKFRKGNDFGFGKEKFVTFVNVNTMGQ